MRSLDEVYSWEQTISQQLLLDVVHPLLGTITLPGSPLRFEPDWPVERRPPPRLGEHDVSVRAWLAEEETT